MLGNYLFLFPAVFSITVKEELGAIYLTEGEYYELYLSDYFIGNDLSFEIGDTNMTSDSVILENKCEFEMISFLPYPNPNWNQTWAHSTLQNFQTFDSCFCSDDIIIWYNLKYIALYNFSSEQGEIKMIWNGFIDSEYQNPQIEDVKIYKDDFEDSRYAIIWVKQQEKTLIWRNDLYFIDLSNLLDIENPKWLNFSEITYASKIVLSYYNFLNQIFIYCEFSSSPNGIYVYNVTNINELTITQVISKYYGIPLNEMSIVSMYAHSFRLYVLDTNFGIIKYLIYLWEEIFLDEYEWIYLGYLGTLNFMWKFYYANTGIISSSDILFLKTDFNNLQIQFLKGNGMNWENGCVQIHSNYYFIQSNDGILSVVSDSEEPLNILYNIDISSIVGSSFEPTGQWGFFITKDMIYVRYDRDGLRIYKVYLENWIIKAWGNSTYYAQIVAKDQNNDIVSSTLNINSIPRDSQEIYQIDLYRPIAIKPLEMIVDGKNETYFTISLNHYFSGPNLEFAVVDLPKFNNINFVVTSMDKLKLYQNISLPDNVTNYFISDGWLVTFYNNKVIVDSDNGSINIDIINPIIFLSDGGWFIYSKPNPTLFLITYYPYADNFQEFSSEIDCLFFLSDLPNLICANSSQIDIYFINSTYYSKVFSLTGEQFDKGSSWNIIDLAVSFPANARLYLYIIDAELGALTIDLYTWYNENHTYTYYGRVPDAIKVINTAKEICFIFGNYIEIYDYPLRYKKRIFTNINEPVVDTYGIVNMIYLITSNTLYIYDSNQPSHNSLFCMLNINSSSLLSFGFIEWGDIRVFNFNLNGHFVEIYRSSCPNKEFYEGCNFEFIIDIQIGNSELFREYCLQTSISISAFNKEYILKESFPIELIFNGEFPWFQNQKWEINKNIPYNQRYEIDLTQFFFGQNILMILSVNGNYSYNETVVNWPAVIPERAKLVGRYSFNNKDKARHIIIPNTEIAIILASSEFIVFKAIGLSNEAVILNLTEISSLTDLYCNFITVFSHTQYNLTLLVTSCTYNILEEINYKNTSMYKPKPVFALIIWEFDYINFEITRHIKLTSYSEINFLRVAPLDTQNFEVMAFYASPETSHYTNDIYRFRGRWDKNNMSLYQSEIINYYSLNLGSFCALLMDFKVKDSEAAYWYILDQQYGIRIIVTSKDSASVLVGGLPIDSQFYSINFGICGEILYLISSKEAISYKIKSYTKLEVDLYYSLYEISQTNYFIMLGLAVCSSNNRYIASPYWTGGRETWIRIWDTEAKNSSNIISEIYAFQLYGIIYGVSMQFIGNSIISFTNVYSDEYRSYKINENYLIFPEMSENEYSKLVDSWGTKKFNMFVVAENGNGEAVSNILYFDREVENKKSENYWWVWLLVSIAIAGCLAGLYLLARRLLKAHRRRSLEAVLMRELHHTDYTQDTDN